MALSISLKINGKDTADEFGFQVTSAIPDILSMPDLEGRGFEVVGRDGSTPSISAYKSRKITINGIMTDTTHANLLTGLKALKQEIAGGHHGRYRFRLDFVDDANIFYLARAVRLDVRHIGPRYISIEAEISITVIIEDAVGIYDILTLSNITGSPFSSPYSGLYQNNGSAIARPRILIENVGAANITSLSLLNLAVRNRLRSITPSGGTAPTRQIGRWSDVAGAAGFTPGGGNNIQFTAQGLFNPGCFSFFCFFKPLVTGNGMNPGYLFSTTGNTVKLYYDSGNSWIAFDINGTVVVATDASTGLTIGEWFAVAAAYDGTTMNLRTYRISTEDDHEGNEETITYRGLPTTLFIGSDATPGNIGYKHMDDIRIYSRPIEGILPTTATADEWVDLKTALGSLPIAKQTSLYLPFDYKLQGIGYENTQLDITATVPQNQYLEVKCDEKDVYLLPDDQSNTPAGQMANVSGEFPFLVPDYNGIQVIHNGSASAVNMAIEDARRYL